MFLVNNCAVLNANDLWYKSPNRNRNWFQLTGLTKSSQVQIYWFNRYAILAEIDLEQKVFVDLRGRELGRGVTSSQFPTRTNRRFLMLAITSFCLGSFLYIKIIQNRFYILWPGLTNDKQKLVMPNIQSRLLVP